MDLGRTSSENIMSLIGFTNHPQPRVLSIADLLRALFHTSHNLTGNGTRYSLHRNKIHLPRRMPRRMPRRRWRHLVVYLPRRHGWRRR